MIPPAGTVSSTALIAAIPLLKVMLVPCSIWPSTSSSAAQVGLPSRPYV